MTLEPASQVAGLESQLRYTFLKAFFRESGLADYGVATSGSTTTIVDTTKLQSTQFNSQEYVGGWARIGYDAGGAGVAPQGEISPITTYAPGTGTITVNPALTTAVAANDHYELWKINPNIILDFLDQILTEDIEVPAVSILTSVRDGDMEVSGTTAWSATNATLTKVSTTPMAGNRYLTVLATAANGYAASINYFVEAGKLFHLSALVRCEDASTSAKLVAWDNTNSAQINAVTVTNLYQARVWFDFTTPSGCKSISIRLQTVENNKTTDWDDVVLFSYDSREELLPYWVKEPRQVKGIFRAVLNGVTTNLYDSTLKGERDPRWDIRDSSDGNNRLKVVCRAGNMTSPLFCLATRPLGSWANDHADTKLVPFNLLLSALMVKSFTYLNSRPQANVINPAWVESNLTKWERKLKQAQTAHEYRLEQIIKSPTPDVYLTHSSYSSDYYSIRGSAW